MTNHDNTAYTSDTTIVAISTPPGIGGIAIARLSGPDALVIADKVWKGKPLARQKTHTAHLGTILDTRRQPLDQAVATIYIAPHSFTGQNTVEFAVHGSQYIQRELLATLIDAGATMALPGEFTRRAFASGRIELTQAEAIADIIASNSRAAHRLAISQLKGQFAGKLDQLREQLLTLVSLMELELDFSEEDVTFADRTQLRQKALEIHTHIKALADSYQTGNAIKNGIPVAIVGPTNAGKSSLLNTLVEDNRAIVSDIHGTTRDTIEETAEIDDYLFRFIDTAGLRKTDDPIEQLGIDRSHRAIQRAHIVITLIDATDPEPGIQNALDIAATLRPHQTHITAINKTDKTPAPQLPDTLSDPILISAKTGKGLPALRHAMTAAIRPRPTAPHTADTTEYTPDTTAYVPHATAYTPDTTAYVPDTTEDIIVTNARQAQALTKAADAAQAMIDALDNGIPTDLVAQDARAVLDTLAEITGQITTADILQTIFARFCIGK